MPSRDLDLKRLKVQGGTHASRWFPRISGIAPNRTTRGPVSSPAKQPTNKGAQQPIEYQIGVTPLTSPGIRASLARHRQMYHRILVSPRLLARHRPVSLAIDRSLSQSPAILRNRSQSRGKHRQRSCGITPN
jgi:hypothetical protein